MDAVDRREILHGLAKAIELQSDYRCTVYGHDDPRLMITTEFGWMDIGYFDGPFEFHWDGARQWLDPDETGEVIRLVRLIDALNAAYESVGLEPGH
jgi:hypothetical protein